MKLVWIVVIHDLLKCRLYLYVYKDKPTKRYVLRRMQKLDSEGRRPLDYYEENFRVEIKKSTTVSAKDKL